MSFITDFIKNNKLYPLNYDTIDHTKYPLYSNTTIYYKDLKKFIYRIENNSIYISRGTGNSRDDFIIPKTQIGV